jgi:hypothetical protein
MTSAAGRLTSPAPGEARSPRAAGSSGRTMIERISDMPAGTVGFRVAGDVESEDYASVLAPELHNALEAGGGLRTLYVICT